MSVANCAICGRKVVVGKSNAFFDKKNNVWTHKKCPKTSNYFNGEGKKLQKLISSYKAITIKNGKDFNVNSFLHYVKEFYDAGFSINFQYNYLLWKFNIAKKNFVSYKNFIFDKQECIEFMKYQKQLAEQYNVYDRALDVIEQQLQINKAIQDEKLEKELEDLMDEDRWY